MKLVEETISMFSPFLDVKKEQTTYKIKYVSSYIEKWLLVVTNVKEVKRINFIDCMCNAGIYSDGEIGTAMRALELFNAFAANHPEKEFNLILNDINPERIKAITYVAKNVVGINASNISIKTHNKDVNVLLSDDFYFNKLFNCYPNRSANLVFVDPYNFCTVKISALEHFLSDKYCELIFNIFTNDYVRNQKTAKMKEYCSSEGIPLCSKAELVKIITERLKTGNIKYSFSYEFKISTNTELYQIMFFTPSIRGLEKLKEALWETFDGKQFHRNEEKNEDQLSFFTKEDVRDSRLDSYSNDARELLIQNFSGQTVDFSVIEEFIIENTMLNQSHIITKILKPLISDNRIKKLGNVQRASNFKSDKYLIGE